MDTIKDNIMMQRRVSIILHIVAFLSAMNILFHLAQLCYIISGHHGGGAGYEEYVVGSIAALILFVVYLVLSLINKLSCQGKCSRYIHMLCVTNIVLYLLAWIYVIAFCLQW